MLSCNEFAFLTEFRAKDNCASKPAIWNFLGSLGVVLSVITNIMILFFFRNYEFSEANLLKRKFSYLQVAVSLSFFSLQYLYYISEITPALKYICA